jgi:seryl-tRNA synthetase
MTKLQGELEDKLVKMLADRDRLLAEVDAVRSAVLEDNPKQNKGLIKMIDRVQELDKYIRQHENRIQGIKQRQKTADNSIRRKQDSKRKILMGALVEHLMETNKISKTFILDELDNFLIRDSDKALFSDYWSSEDLTLTSKE